MLPPHRLKLRVYYEDTDFSGYVYHASYLKFMERGRTEFLRSRGVSNRALYEGENGLALVVGRMSLDFLRPAAMDDELTVVTVLEAARGAVLRLTQEVRREADLLVQAGVLVAAVRGGRVARIPQAMRDALSGR